MDIFGQGIFFFSLLKRTNSAKMNLQLFLFSADCLLEKEKNSLQSSLSPSPSLVCAASFSCGTLVLSHMHPCACSLLHTQTHTKPNCIYTCTHIYTHILYKLILSEFFVLVKSSEQFLEGQIRIFFQIFTIVLFFACLAPVCLSCSEF